MKKIKKKQRNDGFCSKSGIFVEGDIRLDCRKDHDPKYFYPIRLILAFAATLCTAVIAASFIKSEVSPLVMFFHSAMLTFAFGLLASKHLVIKIVSGVYLGFHAISLSTSITDIKNGFYVVANEYLTNVKQTSSDIADMADKIARSNHAYYATEFMVLLITVVALICVAACVYKLDFPILFVATFPILELGIYFGLEPNTAATLVLVIVWIMILCLHIINHNTNRAGRKNTFAIHERRKTFYFTSPSAKASFYAVYIRFIAVICAVVFSCAIVFSAVTGFIRPKKFDEYRYRISHFVSEFTTYDLANMFENLRNGDSLLAVKTVGGTNGGLLGRSDSIRFNGSTSLRLDTYPFPKPLYLRGYVAGIYQDNSWVVPETTMKDVTFDDLFGSYDIWSQDIGFISSFNVMNEGSALPSEMTVRALGASKKFVYAPYSTYFSESSDSSKKKFIPSLDSYIKPSSDEYTIVYSDINEYITDISQIDLDEEELDLKREQILTPEIQDAIDEYETYVYDTYIEPLTSDKLDEAYNEIVGKYLNSDIQSWTLSDVITAITRYFNDPTVGFEYDLKPGKTPEDTEFLDDFLTKKKGYCSYFATAGAQLLRKFGYATRYAEGFMVLPSQLDPEADPNEPQRINVADKCAHAWTEVYVNGLGWYPVEFTPGYENDNPNLSDRDKHQDKKDDPSSSKPEPESSSAADSKDSSSSKADSSSSDASKPDSSSSKASANSSKASSSKAANNPGQGGTDNSAQSPTDHAGYTDSSGPVNAEKGGMSSGTKKLLLSVFVIAFIIGVLFLNRMIKLREMERLTTKGSASDRAMNIYRYMLKYLSLTGLYTPKNVSDMQALTDMLDKLPDYGLIILTERITFISELAVKAHLSGDGVSKEEADKALDMLHSIRREHILDKLSFVGRLAARFIYGLY